MEETTYQVARPSRTPLYILGGLMLLTLIATFTFYSNWRDTEERLQASQLEQQALAKDSYRVSNLIQKNKADREAVADPAYKAVVMRGTGKAPAGLAILYYNPSAREVLLEISRLSEAPPGKQYQLWGMSEGGPTDAGAVKPENMNQGLMKMNPVGGAKSFVLTLENAGGASEPTTAQIYLSGGL